MTAHYLYRVYAANSDLIYIGCTSNLHRRLAHHRTQSWWAYQAERVVAKVYPDKRSARSAEADAIRGEQPRWNLKMRGSNLNWSQQMFVDYVTSATNQPWVTPHSQRHIENVARQYRIRFGHDIPVDPATGRVEQVAIMLPAETESVA